MLRAGDTVRIRLPKNEIGVTRGMLAYNGAETKIAHIDNPTGKARSYILDGCVTDHGMPYYFVEEWLILLDSDESEVSA